MKKLFTYLVLPVLALSVVGISTASAHGWFGGFRNATPQEIATHHQEMFQDQADLLGVSVDAVKDAWANGTGLKELAEQNGISDEDLRSRMAEARTARMAQHLQALVDQGVITQPQADTRLQFMSEFEGKGGMRGFHHGFMPGFAR